jgi:hypothetical protein
VDRVLNDRATGSSQRVRTAVTPSRRMVSGEAMMSVVEKIEEIKDGGGFRDHR